MVQKGTGIALQKPQGTTQLPPNYEKISQDPLKHVVTFIEKKIRNLDKRKAKLDGYRKMVEDGKPLDPDQTAAAAKYDEVIGSLEFAKDLIKSFEATTAEVMKQQRKALRKEQMAREEAENNRICFVVRTTRIMELLHGNEAIRDDFLNGTNGACSLTKVEMDQLVNFYDLFIMKSYEPGSNIVEDANSSGNHMYELAEGRSKDIVGTTYKDLHAVLGRISDSKYFEDLRDTNEVPDIHHTANQVSPKSVSSESAGDEEDAVEEQKQEEEILENGVAEEDAHSADSADHSSNGFSGDGPLKTEEFLPSGNSTGHTGSWEQTQQQPQQQQQQTTIPTKPEAGDFMKTQETHDYQHNSDNSQMIRRAYEAQRIQEVLAEVQGPCQFLQESIIDHEIPASQPIMQFTGMDMLQQQPIPTTLVSHNRQLPSGHLHTSALESAFQNTQTLPPIDQAIITSQGLPNVQQHLIKDPATHVDQSPITHQEHLPVDQPLENTLQEPADQENKFHGVAGQNAYITNVPGTATSQANLEYTMGHAPRQQADNLGLGQTTFGGPQQTPDPHVPYIQNSGEQNVYRQEDGLQNSEPPLPHIPLPGEQHSGYRRYPNDDGSNDIKNVPTQDGGPQDQHGERTQNDMIRKDVPESGDVSPRQGDNGPVQQNNQNASYGSRNSNQAGQQQQQQQHRGHRGGGYYSGNRSGNQGGGGYQQRYNNNYRGRYNNNGNYDSMGRPNYSNNYQGNQSGGNGYRGHQDQYSGGYRRGGGMRGNRSGQGRGSMRNGGNYNKSRTFRPHPQNEQAA